MKDFKNIFVTQQILSILFVGCQVEQNVDKQVQQYMNNDDIENHGVFFFWIVLYLALTQLRCCFTALIMLSIK